MDDGIGDRYDERYETPDVYRMWTATSNHETTTGLSKAVALRLAKSLALSQDMEHENLTDIPVSILNNKIY
jgi:hypothetical protein